LFGDLKLVTKTAVNFGDWYLVGFDQKAAGVCWYLANTLVIFNLLPWLVFVFCSKTSKWLPMP
jgi:hypothetical protein